MSNAEFRTAPAAWVTHYHLFAPRRALPFPALPPHDMLFRHTITLHQMMAAKAASNEEGAAKLHGLLAARSQEVADLTSKASAEAAAANEALAELEGLRAEDKREARRQLAEKAEEVKKAAAAAREAEERGAEEAGERSCFQLVAVVAEKGPIVRFAQLCCL